MKAQEQLWTASALLFDMDGTLVDSTAAVERVWGRFATRYGINIADILAVSHGRRTLDIVSQFAPHGVDPVAETTRINAEERQERADIVAIPGAAHMLSALPLNNWAVVTSADRALARLRLRLAGLPLPRILIAAEDVTNGKPSPEGYLLAAQRLAVDARDTVIFEDTPAGLAAGRAAGARVVALTTTFGANILDADLHINDYHSIAIDSRPKQPSNDALITPLHFALA